MLNPVPSRTIITCSAHFCDTNLLGGRRFEAILFLVCTAFTCIKQFYLRRLISSAALCTSVISWFISWEMILGHHICLAWRHALHEYAESSFTLSSDLLWSGFIWWEMVWGHHISGFKIFKKLLNILKLLSNFTSQSTNNAKDEYKYHAVFVLQRTG